MNNSLVIPKQRRRKKMNKDDVRNNETGSCEIPYETLRQQASEATGQRVLDAKVNDPWRHRSKGMKCRTCMFFVEKARDGLPRVEPLGRCRRHAPTMSGFPAVFTHDWCGDHKLDENKI